MAVTVERICQIMEEWAPKTLAADWDSVGLQIGDPSREVLRLMVTIEVTPEVVNSAVEHDVQMIVCHHPFIFRPVKALRLDNWPGNAIGSLIKNDISVYVSHTNLDVAPGGVDDLLAEAIGIKEPQVLSPIGSEKYHKIVVFVPQGHENGVRDAMAAAGAGHIGNYSHCTFQTPGHGTFKPLEGSSPFIGQLGKMETVEEYRLETIVPENRYRQVIAAMIKAHPYEAVAYDVYPLSNDGPSYGFGRIGKLQESMTFRQFTDIVARALNLEQVRAIGNPDAQVKKVASSCGSGEDQIRKAIFAGADVLVTGDVKYHGARDALAHNLSVIDAGHYNTEALIVPEIAKYLREKTQSYRLCLEVIEIDKPADPFWYIGSESKCPEESKPENSQVIIHIDGASRGNPGLAACGVVISDPDGNTLKEAGFYLGTATNNVAEYNGFLHGLEMANTMGAKEVTLISDSELVVKQINSEYKVKDPKLIVLYQKALQQIAKFDKVDVVHVRRTSNKRADALANHALDLKNDICEEGTVWS